jgi:hypothetical protein
MKSSKLNAAIPMRISTCNVDMNHHNEADRCTIATMPTRTSTCNVDTYMNHACMTARIHQSIIELPTVAKIPRTRVHRLPIRRAAKIRNGDAIVAGGGGRASVWRTGDRRSGGAQITAGSSNESFEEMANISTIQIVVSGCRATFVLMTRVCGRQMRECYHHRSRIDSFERWLRKLSSPSILACQYNRPISVNRFPRRARTLCPQLCMGIPPGTWRPLSRAER